MSLILTSLWENHCLTNYSCFEAYKSCALEGGTLSALPPGLPVFPFRGASASLLLSPAPWSCMARAILDLASFPWITRIIPALFG